MVPPRNQLRAFARVEVKQCLDSSKQANVFRFACKLLEELAFMFAHVQAHAELHHPEMNSVLFVRTNRSRRKSPEGVGVIA